MDRRSVLGAAAGLLGALAGCNAVGGGRTVAPDLRGTPTATPTRTATPTPTPAPEPYVGAGAARLDRPRDVILTNQRLDDARASVTIRDGRTRVLETVETVPAAGEVTVSDVVAGAGAYDVRVVTADGRGGAFAWAADADAGDLGVDLDTDVTPRDRYRGGAAVARVRGDTAALVGGREAGTYPLVVDNGGGARTVEFALSNDEGFAGLGVRVPADSRVALPLAIRGREVSVVARVGESHHRSEWRPLADGALYVAADGPEFLCDLLRRDLRIHNDTSDTRTVSVNVAGNGREQFDGEFLLGEDERVVREAVVGPAAGYEIEVESRDRAERYEWETCPPVGPVEVRVDAEGVDVSVRPTRPTGERGDGGEPFGPFGRSDAPAYPNFPVM